MSPVLGFLFFVLFLNETEFERIPPLFKIDNYDSCLQEPTNVYCKLFFRLVSDEPNELLSLLQEHSEPSIKRFDHTKLKHGVCVSQRCQNYIQNNTAVSESDLEGCLNQTFWDNYRLKTRLQQHFCYNKSDSEIKIENSDIFTGIIVFTILALNIFGTIYDIYVARMRKQQGNSIILSFSIKRNWKNLTRTGYNDGRFDDFKSFNGLRCFTAYGVIHVHAAISYYIIGRNIYDIESYYSSPLYQLVLNGTIMMEMFFVLAGFQLAYQFCVLSERCQIGWNIIPKAICRRLLRILPAYAIVILLTATWLKFLGPGPFWEAAGGLEHLYCKRNWWKNILFFNNYVHDEKCLVTTWSIAADMQLYVFSVILIILIGNSRFRQTILTSLVVIGGVVVAVHTYIRDLDATFLLKPTETSQMFITDSTFNEIYRSAHGHMCSYVIGMSLGYFIYKWQKEKVNIRKYSLKLKLLFWSIIPMIIAVVLSGAVFYRDAPRDPAYVRAICAALNKPILGFIIALSIAGLVMKVENVYRKILEWDVWVILSKLTYSLYLIHYPVLQVYINLQPDLVEVSHVNMTATAIAVTITSLLSAIPLYLLVEAPFSSILNGQKHQHKEITTKMNDRTKMKQI